MWRVDYPNNLGRFLLRGAFLILAMAGTASPLACHALGPETHLVRWSKFGTNFFASPTNSIRISSGFFFDLAVRADGTVAQHGGPDTPPAGLSNVVAIAAAYGYSLAASADGSVTGWGDTNFGAIDIPSNATNVVDVGGGWHHSAALRADGTVVGWGHNGYGQNNIPPGLSNVVAITIGYSYDLALRADGTVVAWGVWYYDGVTPVSVPAGLSNVVSVTGGIGHIIALRADGSLVAWGSNTYGETNIPPEATNIVAIAAPVSTGGDHNFALRKDGALFAWGCTCDGGSTVLPGLTNVVAIASGSNGDGSDYNLALIADGPFFTSPRLDISFGNGVAQIKIQGEPHRRYVLESTSSPDGTAGWTFERNVLLTASPQNVHQFSVPQAGARFYRARQLY